MGHHATSVLLIILGVVAFIAGIIGVYSGWQIREQGSQLIEQGLSKIEDGKRLLDYSEVKRRNEFEFTVTDKNPICRHDVGKLLECEEIRVTFDCSLGGIMIGIMDKDAWEKLEKESTLYDSEVVKANSNDNSVVPTKEEIEGDFPGKILPEVVKIDKAEIKFMDGRVSGKTVLKPAEIEPYYIEVMYVFKRLPGSISGRVFYEVVAFPKKDEGAQLIQEGTNLKNTGESRQIPGLALMFGCFFGGIIGGLALIAKGFRRQYHPDTRLTILDEMPAVFLLPKCSGSFRI